MYDYVPGKVDWLARGLPTEGERADEERVGDRARDDVVTCRLDAPVEPVRDEIDASRYGFALVTTEDGTLLGRLRGSSLEDGVSGTAEEHMDPGPSTVRPDMAIADLRERLDDKGLKTAIVSTPEGRLMGVVTRGALD